MLKNYLMNKGEKLWQMRKQWDNYQAKIRT